MNNALRAATALLVFLFLTGCGQSGPLYVPGDPSIVRPEPQEQQTTREEDEEDDNGATSP